MQPSKATVQTLFEGDKQFLIPLFQRHYVWEKMAQWQPLWADIVAKCESAPQKQLPHFTGAIVIQQKSTPSGALPVYEIIDGQQRLTTFQVILCAFRGICHKAAEAEGDGRRFAAMEEEANRFLLNTSMRAKKQENGKYKLLPTQFDRCAMSWLVNHDSVINNDTPSARPSGKLIDAYWFFREKIRLFVDNDADKAEKLLTTIRESFGFVEILIDGDDEPEMIFESLNARGKPLLAFDLLRNYLFLRTRQSEGEDRDELYKKYWEHFETDHIWDSTVKVARSRITMSELFLQHFLTATLAMENVYPFFQTYREEYSKQLPDGYRTRDELSDLHRYSQKYLPLAISNHDSDVGRAMQIYHYLDITSLRPFFLYLLADVKVSGKVRDHIFHALESYTVRRVLCTSQGHKNYNKFFPELIKKLRSGDGFTAKKMLELLKSQESDTRKWPQFQNVQSAFRGQWKISGANINVIRYILYRIECKMQSENPRSEDIALNFTRLTLEHILPESWEKTWQLPGGILLNDIYSEEYKKENPLWSSNMESLPNEGFANDSYANARERAEEREMVVQSIGNLTLLTRSLNASASNKSFNDKKQKLERDSLLFLNRKVCQEEDWDVAQIREREKELCKIFCEIWPDAQWFLDNIPEADGDTT